MAESEGRTGPRKDTVPNIVGQTTTNADSQIVSAGFTVGTKSTTNATGSQTLNTVVSQVVAADTEYPLGMAIDYTYYCLLYTSPSPRDLSTSRMPSSA